MSLIHQWDHSRCNSIKLTDFSVIYVDLLEFYLNNMRLSPILHSSRNRTTSLWQRNKLLSTHILTVIRRIFCSKNQRSYLSKDSDDPCLKHNDYMLSNDDISLAWIHCTLNNIYGVYSQGLPNEIPKTLALSRGLWSLPGKMTKLTSQIIRGISLTELLHTCLL